MDRRDFLTGTASLFGALMTASCSTRMPGYTNRPVSADKGKLFLGLNNSKNEAVLRILNLNDDSFQDFPIPVNPHSFLRSPLSQEEVLVIGFGEASGVINLSTGKTSVTRQPTGAMFNGHGTMVSNDEIWCTENFVKGQIIARPRRISDLTCLKGEDVSFEAGHHIVRLPGTTILASGGFSIRSQQNFVTFYDFAQRKVLGYFPTEYVPVHLIPYSSSEVFMVTNKPVSETSGDSHHQKVIMGTPFNLQAPTPVVSFNLSGESKNYWDEKKKDLFKFGLGIRKMPDGRILTGHTWSSTIICWNNGRMEKTLSVPHPQAFAVTRDESQLAIHCSEGLRVYSLNGMEHLRTISYPERIISMSTYT